MHYILPYNLSLMDDTLFFYIYHYFFYVIGLFIRIIFLCDRIIHRIFFNYPNFKYLKLIIQITSIFTKDKKQLRDLTMNF